MSDRNQPWMRGDAKPVVTKAVPSANVIECGDLVGLSSGDPYAAAGQAWDTDLATTQAAFVANFLGCTPERSRSGDTEAIKVNTGGVHLFDCASATFEIGDLVGPAKASGNALESKKVVAVATENLAIGRVAKRGTSITTVEVEIFGSKTKGRTA